MTSKLTAMVLPQIDELIIKFDQLQKRTKYRDFSDISTSEASEFITAGVSMICRIAGPKSEYAQQVDQYIKHHLNHPTLTIPHVGGALKALRHDVASGYLINIQELIHANVFADFLEMAEHLLEEGYKDAAAVMIGGVLEEHLRKLSNKHGIQLDFIDNKGASKPKKADKLNAELASNNIYTKLDQKSVVAWLDLRNKAAHAHYSEYSATQVEQFLQSIRDFLVRNPA